LIKKPVIVFSLFILIIFLIFALVSCCLMGSALNSLSKQADTTGISLEEIVLNADFDIYQEGAVGNYLEKNIPVVFKCKDYEINDSQKTKYSWKIDGQTDLDGPVAGWTFDSSGDHNVSLMVSQGASYASTSKNINICDGINKLLIIRTHEADVQIKYKIENKGPGSINNIRCRIETPYDFYPFQTIIELSADNENSKEITDKNGNTIYRFNIENLKEGSMSESNMDCVVNISEFIIKPQGQDLAPQKYDFNDSEIKKYTKSEKFIDSNSNKIIDAANTITAGEEDPFKKAEMLYNFVIKKLDYDYERMKEKSFKISEASDILNWDKGVCTDYSLLYASLCRAAGIPCKFIVGLSLHSISSEYNGVSSMSHAWNEIKLPGYGWVPIDATSEIPFASANSSLNLKTFEGTGSLYQSTKIDGYPANALGYFYYYPDEDSIPEIFTENIYTVTGISKNNEALN
jgi:hypothetical protein